MPASGKSITVSANSEAGLAVMRQGPTACAPSAVEVAASFGALHAVGSGCRLQEDLPAGVRAQLASVAPELLPSARDLSAAGAGAPRDEVQQPQQVQPLCAR